MNGNKARKLRKIAAANWKKMGWPNYASLYSRMKKMYTRGYIKLTK